MRPADKNGIWLRKSCPDHGKYFVKIWGDRISFEDWDKWEEPLTEMQADACVGDCRACTEKDHGQGVCCVILEVTKRCNMRCTYCFARGGEELLHPSYDELCAEIDDIAVKGDGPMLQLAGGEPTLRDDLPDLVWYAKKAGCQYAQANTNGIRIAEDESFVRKLAEAGLDIAFLQFDGLDDGIYRKLRGREFLEIKRKAIQNCGKYNIGVTLVPTIVRGINDQEIGKIVRFAAEMFPAVKAVHFQPVTYLGRYPKSETDHYTLDELMADICLQTGIPESAFLPSRCDHALCEFHSTFMVSTKRQLIPMSDRAQDTRRERTNAVKNRQYVAEHWSRSRAFADISSLQAPDPSLPLVSCEREEMEFDEFVRKMKTQTLKVSAMAFQDAMNIDLEKLYRCALRVYEDGRLLPFCAKYMTPWHE